MTSPGTVALPSESSGEGVVEQQFVPAWLARQIMADPAAPLAAAVVGPGGCGKTAILDAIAKQYRRAGIPVVRADASRPVSLDDLVTDHVVLVDQAHELDGVVLEWLRDLADRDEARIVVAYRPWPRPAGLQALSRSLVRGAPPVVVGHFDRARVAARLNALIGSAAPPSLVDTVHEQSGGVPTLVDLLLHALRETGRFDPARPADFRKPERLSVGPALIERLRYSMDTLEPGVHGVLHALAVGSDLDVEILCRLLDAKPETLEDWVESARATGLLTEDGSLVPFIRTLLLKLAPTLRTRDLQQRLADIQLERGGSVLASGRQLLSAGATGSRVARILEVAGDEALATAPRLAAELYAGAVKAGGSVAEIAARRAQATALGGDLDQALSIADQVVADPKAPDRDRGTSVAAAVLAHRGLLARSAELYRMLPRDANGPSSVMAVPGLVGTGRIAEARELLAEAQVAQKDRSPTLLAGTEALMARGVLDTVDGSTTSALSQLARAAVLLEPAGRTTVLPDTPAALTALVAMNCGELAVAESALARAIKTRLGGRPAQARHLLLYAWTAMAQGRLGVAHRVLAKVAPEGATLEPRDELLAVALAVGLARRDGDLTALGEAWSRARSAIVRHPIDLYVLQPLGELAVAAARLGDREWVRPHLEEAQQLLDSLGNPPLWETSLRWYRLHAAIVAEQPAEARDHTVKLTEAAANSRYAGILAAAASSWLRVLAGEFDPAAVQAAANRLGELGLAWEGARLAGQAALRTTDRRAMAALLGCARTLQGKPAGADPTAGPEVPDTDIPPQSGPAQSGPAQREDGALAAVSASVAVEQAPSATRGLLSDREVEVGQLILDGLTYKQIGARLFISAKTVEHHVARMRNRLGAASRDELFGKLRALLSAPNTNGH